jgi:hypothetical protein
MTEKFEVQKELLIKSILEQYSQNNVNIQYSSLWAAKYGKSRLIWPIRIFSSLLTVIPIVLEILRSYGIIDNSNRSVMWIIIVCLFSAALMLLINPDWMESVLSMKRKEANELLDLNKRLQLYEYKLEGLYNEVCASKTNINALQSKFNSLRMEHNNDVNLHDKLTGVIDKELEAEAQKKTREIMDVKNLVIYE